MLKKITSGIACMTLALLVGCGGGEGNTGSDPGNSFAGRKSSYTVCDGGLSVRPQLQNYNKRTVYRLTLTGKRETEA